MRSLLTSVGLVGLVFASAVPAQQRAPAATHQWQHPAIGSWYGKAVQVCGEPLSACPKAVLFMTPTITVDGLFLGNDTFALAGPPFGPHTTAHGNWAPTSLSAIVADYVFLSPVPVQGAFPSTGALRFRWQAEVVDPDTMVGYVNIFTAPPVPTVWESLGPAEFPTVPKEGCDLVEKPAKFYREPRDCNLFPASSCPLIFKFKIMRVQSE